MPTDVAHLSACVRAPLAGGVPIAWCSSVIKLTRLNRQVVAINPDLILFVDIVPDTTICLAGGDKILVRESLDELIDRVIEFRRKVRSRVVSSAQLVRSRAEEARLLVRDGSRESRPPLLRVVDKDDAPPESR